MFKKAEQSLPAGRLLKDERIPEVSGQHQPNRNDEIDQKKFVTNS